MMHYKTADCIILLFSPIGPELVSSLKNKPKQLENVRHKLRYYLTKFHFDTT